MKVEWRHDFDDEPVWLYSEIEDGWEIRKVEVYRDGRSDFADGQTETGKTGLSEVLMLTAEEISQDPEFVAEAIDGQEFEQRWSEAVSWR